MHLIDAGGASQIRSGEEKANDGNILAWHVSIYFHDSG